jgi:DNA gyrase subunit B
MVRRASEGMIVRHGEFASRIEGAGLTRFMSTLNEYLAFVEKVDKRIRNEKLTELLARAELIHRADFTSRAESDLPPKLVQLHAQLAEQAEDFGFKSLGAPIEDEEHHTWSIRFTDAQGAERHIDWTLASSPEFRQMMSKYTLIKEFLEPPFLIEYAVKPAAESSAAHAGPAEASPGLASEDETEAAESEAAEGASQSAEAQAEARQARRAARAPREPVEKQTARELFAYIVEQGKKDYQVQRYKGLGEMTSTQLWETTMDPERRTLLQVKLEDFVETEEIFATLMGEDVEKRRKFIEDNALDVKNLDI